MEVASAGDSIELTTRPAPSRLLPKGAIVVLTTVGVVLGALGWAYALLGGPRDEFHAERQAVLTRASDFAVTFNTYKVADKADYQRRVKKLMTEKHYAEFARITNAMFTVLRDKDQSSGDAKVLSVAVDQVDKDSATALVAVNSAVRVEGEKGAVQRRFRWQISLTKVGGQWLVDRFDTVPPMNATLGDVAGKSGSAR